MSVNLISFSNQFQSSFGFGQVGGTALIIHPRYLFGSLNPKMYNDYKEVNRARYLATYKAMSEMMINGSLVKLKTGPPYNSDLEIPVLLNALARATPDAKGSFSFSAQLPKVAPKDLSNLAAFTNALQSEGAAGVGIDHGEKKGSVT